MEKTKTIPSPTIFRLHLLATFLFGIQRLGLEFELWLEMEMEMEWSEVGAPATPHIVINYKILCVN